MSDSQNSISANEMINKKPQEDPYSDIEDVPVFGSKKQLDDNQNQLFDEPSSFIQNKPPSLPLKENVDLLRKRIEQEILEEEGNIIMKKMNQA